MAENSPELDGGKSVTCPSVGSGRPGPGASPAGASGAVRPAGPPKAHVVSSRTSTGAFRYEGSREYPFTVAEAWTLLADTDHLNRLSGLPAVTFGPPAGPGGGFVRSARTRILGLMPLRWKEHPFEWVRERRWSVRRQFDSGFWRETRIGLELERIPSLGFSSTSPAEMERVRVKAVFDFVPSGALGRLLTPWAGARSVRTLLMYCDRYLERLASARTEAVPPPRAAPQIDNARLERGLAKLAKSPVRPELLAPLRERILEGSDPQVLRVQPYAVAERWGAEPLQVLRLFLYATRAGIFDLRWELMCPACKVPKDEVESLSSLPERFHCETCGIDYETDFDQRVELRFSLNPLIRLAREEIYCIGSPLRTPHVLAQQLLAPGETREVELDGAEPLNLKALGGMQGLALAPTGTRSREGASSTTAGRAGGGSPRTLRLRYSGGMWMPEAGAAGEPAAALPFDRGCERLALANASDEPVVAVLERAEWDPHAATAAEVTALQEFRDLFSSEVLAPGQEVGVRRIALLFSDLKGSTALYEDVGDAPAYGRVNRHFEFLREKIVTHRGAIVKTIGDAVMATFRGTGDALAAALEMQSDIHAWCAAQAVDPPFVLKLGLHEGPVIAVNANDRLDYFGRTVNLAARTARESEGGDVVVLKSLFDEELGRGLLEQWPSVETEVFRSELRGIGEVPLVRLRVMVPEPLSVSGRP